MRTAGKSFIMKPMNEDLGGAPQMHIETQRLLIRDYTIDDMKDLQDILGDDEVMKKCEPAYSPEKTANFLREFCIEKKEPSPQFIRATAK